MVSLQVTNLVVCLLRFISNSTISRFISSLAIIIVKQITLCVVKLFIICNGSFFLQILFHRHNYGLNKEPIFSIWLARQKPYNFIIQISKFIFCILTTTTNNSTHAARRKKSNKTQLALSLVLSLSIWDNTLGLPRDPIENQL